MTMSKWLSALLLLSIASLSTCRVVDDNELDFLRSQLAPEDPYEEDPFEEDRYGEPMQGDQPQETQRPFRECRSPQDCLPDECCRIGMQRFSIPICERLGAEGEFCRMYQEPSNSTLEYPNGEQKVVTDHYILFCPCSSGLTCLRATCRPQRELFLQPSTPFNTL